jgi:quercetin dioxygenase-like cupin family protein
MKQKINTSFFLAFLMSFTLIACNNEEKKAEPAAAEAEVKDAVATAPGVYKVIADTMNIRILEIIVKPGEEVAMHSHPDYSLYVIEGGKTEFTAKDGTKQTQELSAGTGLILPAEVHAAKNTGTTTVRAIATETTRTAAAARDATSDPATSAPGVYKVLADTLNLRLLEITVKPGESVPLHSHPDYSQYVLEGGTGEFMSKDGTKTSSEIKTGMAVIAPAETHGAKNTGTTTIRIIATEVFRSKN